MKDVLDLLVILDRSGSMQDARDDHEGGLRSFVKDQCELEGDVRLTLVQFDSQDACEIVFDRVPIREVPVAEIQLIPRGGTPLFDAVGRAVAHVKKFNPERVVAMIITDGEENSSREWTLPQVKKLVESCEKQNWQFLFLGANIDAFANASAMGVGVGNGLGGAMSAGFSNTHGTGTVSAAYCSTSHNLRNSRVAQASGAADYVSHLAYTDQQREDMEHGHTVTVTDTQGNSTTVGGK